MEMSGKIRRMYLRDKLSLHEITKRTSLSRNTVRKRVRPLEGLSAQVVKTADAILGTLIDLKA